MPIPEPLSAALYGETDPYHYTYDNIPLFVINDILQKVILQSNAAEAAVLAAVGSQPDLATRLAVSINDDGTLIESAIDAAMHNIAAHLDGSITLSTDEIAALNTATGLTLVNPVPFVRMTYAERAKLGNMASGATAFNLFLVTADQTLSNATVNLTDTAGITWTLTGGNILKANLGFSISSLHEHTYDETPGFVSYDSVHGLTTYIVASPSGYNSGSLRVTVNGTRLPGSGNTVSVLSGLSVNSNVVSCTALTTRGYAEVDNTAGTFTISGGAMNVGDVVVVDYDTAV